MVSIFIFIIQLSVFSLLAFALHYCSPKIGLAPLLFIIGGMVGLLNLVGASSLMIVLESGYVLHPVAHVMVPVVLLIILLLYVTQGTRTAQIVVIGIIGVNALTLVTFFFLLVHTNFMLPSTTVLGAFTDSTVFNLSFFRRMIASLVAFTADMLVLIIVYQGTYNGLKWVPKALIPGIALIIALWTDSMIFNMSALLGTDLFSFRMPSDVLIKTLAGIWIAPFAGWYLTYLAPQIPDFLGADKRATLAILFRHGHHDKQLESLESELRISRSVYHQLTEHIEEIFWIIDVEKPQFVYMSPAYERITDYSVEPLYQDFNNVTKIFYNEKREVTAESVLRFLTSQKDIEFPIIRPNKVIRWLRARSFPIEDGSGTIVRYAGVAEDITERKKLTEQDFELALTRERIKVLHDFISDASHDLKTPLSSMMLKISLLEKIKDEDRRSELRRELRERASHLSDLITDLFTLSRIEGHDVIEVNHLDLNQIVKDVVAEMQILADEKGLNLSLGLSSDDMMFTGNADQISRVVSNFVTNAIRYTSVGNIRIHTWLEDEKVCVYVQDTGMGIPEDTIGRVFERFFRTSQAKNTQEGTGLGLAIAKAIVDRHHGDIMVDSVAGEGSIFTLKLPKTHDKVISIPDARQTTQEIRVLPPDA